jgi:hypothetical protein
MNAARLGLRLSVRVVATGHDFLVIKTGAEAGHHHSNHSTIHMSTVFFIAGLFHQFISMTAQLLPTQILPQETENWGKGKGDPVAEVGPTARTSSVLLSQSALSY